MKKIFIYISALTFVVVSCEYEKLPAPILPHKAVQTSQLTSAYTELSKITSSSSVWKNADYFVVSISNLSVNNKDADGYLNSTGTYNGLTDFGDTVNLILRSVYDVNNIYILAEWKDVSLDATGRIWLWNGPSDPLKSDSTNQWTIQKNEDKLILKFNISGASTITQDVWEWSVTNSDPLGYAVDMNFSSTNGLAADEGTPMFVKNGIGSRGGPAYEFDGTSQSIVKADGSKGLLDGSYYMYNKTEFKGNPAVGAVMYAGSCGECHGPSENAYATSLFDNWFNARSRSSIASFIRDPVQHSDGNSHVVNFTDQSLDEIFAYIRGQSGIPAFYLQTPSGSVADVYTTSNVVTSKVSSVNKAGYKVLFTRKLATGHVDDITFETTDGNTYSFSVGVCNKDSLNYIGAKDQKLVFKKSWDE